MLDSLERYHFNQMVDVRHTKHEWGQEDCLHEATALQHRHLEGAFHTCTSFSSIVT